MAASAHAQNESLVTFSVTAGGNNIPESFRVLSVRVEKNINRISCAKIVVLDGDPSTGTFAASSSAIFLPGAEISIEAGYDSTNRLIFKGIITGQSLRIDETIGSALEVECRDAAVKMTVGRKSASFAQKKDSDIISSIIAGYSGLTAKVAATDIVWPQQVQYYASDWDFMLARAEVNGLSVNTLNGTVSVMKLNADTTSVLEVAYGNGLLGFNANLNSLTQYGNVKANAWDHKTQAVNTQQASPDVAGAGNLSPAALSQVAGLSAYELQAPASVNDQELKAWAQAEVIKSEYSKIRGEAKFQGTAVVEPGKYITLNGLGDRFSGDHLVSGLVHEIADGNWTTNVSIGLPASWSTENTDVMAPPAAGLLPGVSGLFTGVVKKMYGDPDSQFRVLVTVPLFDAGGEGIWARLSNFYSSNGAGAFFMPEVGDEVVLGFLGEDPRSPVILGSMYSSTKNVPSGGLAPVEKNPLKAIVSKSGITLQFDDENKILTIATPGKNTVIISDKDKKITVADQNSNLIVMSSAGITIKTPKDLNLEAGQNINLKASQGIKATASAGDVEISGLNIKEKAQSQYSAEGSMTAKVSAGTHLVLRAAMIDIN